MLTIQEEKQERENGEMLAGMMGGVIESEAALRVLRKHKGDMQKAAEAILAGDMGEETLWNTSQVSQDSQYTEPAPSISAPPVTRSSSTVIDLTADEDDYTRAVQLSMETSQSDVKFGPTERAPDPAWQMVPSNVQTISTSTQDDHTLRQAIQASLNDFTTDDEAFPFDETVREGGRPVALRPELSTIAYAALVLQGLFFVPQVRASIAKMALPEIDTNLPRDSPERAIWNLMELFTNMDLAQLAAIVDNETLPSLQAQPLNGPPDLPGDLTDTFMTRVGQLIEHHLNTQKDESETEVHLFHFFHGRAEIRGISSPKIQKKSDEGSVVVVDVGPQQSSPNDLISRLAVNLNTYHEDGSSHDVIFEPSDVVSFHLKPLPDHSSFSSVSHATKVTADPFVFPKYLYLDQFLIQNIVLANQKRAQEREMIEEIKALKVKRQILTHFDGRDTLRDLRATLHYYEKVAESRGNDERGETIKFTTAKLRGILTNLEKSVKEIEHKIETLQAESAVLFDCPELQQYRYDLRVVLMHTGVPGRKQIYSYVQDTKGIWWKTVDYTVTEVSEEVVLTDPTGLHLGGGPYMLMYSKHLSDEDLNIPVIWPKIFTDSVEDNNRTFLSMLPPELAAKAKVPDDAPSLESISEAQEIPRLETPMDIVHAQGD